MGIEINGCGKQVRNAIFNTFSLLPKWTSWPFCIHGENDTIDPPPPPILNIWCFIFFIVKNSHEQTKTDSEVILLTNIDCVVKAWFICATDGHCVFNSFFLTTIELFGTEESGFGNTDCSSQWDCFIVGFWSFFVWNLLDYDQTHL